MSAALPALVPYAGAVIAAPVLGLRALGALAGARADADHGLSPEVLEVTRALPHNVTTEMDLALWHVAEVARDEPGRFDAALQAFLDVYGVRAVGEIDLGRHAARRRTSRRRPSSSVEREPPRRPSNGSSPLLRDAPPARCVPDSWGESPDASGSWPAAGSCPSSPS